VRGTLLKRSVVAPVMSSLVLVRALEAKGARLLRTQVGDRYVVEEMRRGGYNLGGEQSGHLVFLDHASTGDGTLAALQVLAVALRAQKPISVLAAAALERVPQVLHNVTLPARRAIEEMPKLRAHITRVEGSLGRKGRVLVRWSGTEAKLRIMLEGPKESQLRGWASELEGAARSDLSTS